MVEAGRMCIKKYGRDAGSRAVIMAVEKDGFVKIMTAKRPAERRCNTSHLEFLNEKIDVKNREQINKALGIPERPKQQSKA